MSGLEGGTAYLVMSENNASLVISYFIFVCVSERVGMSKRICMYVCLFVLMR
jgi:hypothetical protein